MTGLLIAVRLRLFPERTLGMRSGWRVSLDWWSASLLPLLLFLDRPLLGALSSPPFSRRFIATNRYEKLVYISVHQSKLTQVVYTIVEFIIYSEVVVAQNLLKHDWSPALLVSISLASAWGTIVPRTFTMNGGSCVAGHTTSGSSSSIKTIVIHVSTGKLGIIDIKVPLTST